MEIYFKRKYVFSSVQRSIHEMSVQYKINVREELDTPHKKVNSR